VNPDGVSNLLPQIYYYIKKAQRVSLGHEEE
jgi:hypothetical protein